MNYVHLKGTKIFNIRKSDNKIFVWIGQCGNNDSFNINAYIIKCNCHWWEGNRKFQSCGIEGYCVYVIKNHYVKPSVNPRSIIKP